METKAQLIYDQYNLLYRDDNKSYRKERLWSGVCAAVLSVALAALGLPFFHGRWLYMATIGIAAAAFFSVAVYQIIVCIALGSYPHACIIDMERIVIREKRKYHYIDFDELGVVRFRCKTLQGGFDGKGCHRVEIIDGAVYYFIGELKKRFATRDAAKIAFIIDHRRRNDEFRDWGRVYDQAVVSYKRAVSASSEKTNKQK